MLHMLSMLAVSLILQKMFSTVPYYVSLINQTECSHREVKAAASVLLKRVIFLRRVFWRTPVFLDSLDVEV